MNKSIFFRSLLLFSLIDNTLFRKMEILLNGDVVNLVLISFRMIKERRDIAYVSFTLDYTLTIL